MPCTLTAIYAHPDFTLENSRGDIVDPEAAVWTQDIYINDGPLNSMAPALFRAGHALKVLTVEVELGAEFGGIDVHLLGALDGEILFQSDASAGCCGRWTTDVHANFDVSALARKAGDVRWSLQSPGGGQMTTVATTRLELTWIYQEPAALFDGHSRIKLLRHVFAEVDTAAAPAGVVADVASLCYFGFNKVYDVVNGASFYGCNPHGGVFELGDYLVDHPQAQPVNCYDQAGVVQTLLGSLGVPNTWQYMSPFGYINNTYLIGVGMCNNPFYMSNETPPVIGPNHPGRSAFSSHAFVSCGPAVVDSCTGPHEGKSSLSTYLEHAIDTRTTLATPNNTGTAVNVLPSAGVASVAFAPGAREDPELPPGMQDIMGSKEAVRLALSDVAAALDWNALMGQLCIGYRMQEKRRSLTPSIDGAFSRWTLESASGQVIIRVFKAQNRHAALAREIDYLASFQVGPAKRLSRQPDLGAAGLIAHDKKLVMFVHRNVFVLLAGETDRAHDIARDIYSALDAAPRSERRIKHTHEAITLQPGERRTLATAMKVHHSLAGTAVRLMGRRPYELDIRGQQPGISRMRLAQVSEATLDMDLHQVRIEVLA
jgi:hypothetical protein